MGPGAVDADAKHLRIQVLELRQVIAEALMFVGADRAEVEGIKRQHDGLPLEIAQFILFVIVASEGKIRRFLSYCHWHGRSLLYRRIISSFGSRRCNGSTRPSLARRW